MLRAPPCVNKEASNCLLSAKFWAMTVNETDRTSDLGRPKLDWQEGVVGDVRGGLGRGLSRLKTETLIGQPRRLVFWERESSGQKERQVSLPGGERLCEMLRLRDWPVRMGQRETAELEGGSSSGRAQSSVQFLSYTEGNRNSVKDWKEQVMQTDTPVGKIPLPA